MSEPRWLDTLRTDLRVTIRSLARQPAFTAAVLVTLALGLGVNAAMFTFLDRVYLQQPSGVVNPSSLRRLWTIALDTKGKVGALQTSLGALDARTLTAAFGHDAALALYARQPNVRIGDDIDPPTTTIIRAGVDYFPLLGVHAERGRLFSTDEATLDAPAHVAVISDAFWREHYRGDASAIGERVTLSGVRFTIIGVVQRGFAGVDLERSDIWVPLGKSPVGMDAGIMFAARRGPRFGALVRLAPAASDASIEARATAVVRRADAGDVDADSLERVVTGSIIEARGAGNDRAEVGIAARLGGVAIIVLLIACANVVNLLLARAVARRREIAVRVALGVSRGRLIWLLSVPCVMLSLAAGVAAAASALVTGTVLRSQLVPDIHIADAPIEWRVIAFTLLASLVAGALSAIVPAIQASNPDVTSFLKSGTGGGIVQRSRLRSVLVGAQAALSVVLLVGSGLFLQSLRNVDNIRLGYDVPHLLFASTISDSWMPPDSATFAAAAEQIGRVPGVEQVAMATLAPISGGMLATPFYTATDSSRFADIYDMPTFMGVSANYFTATGVRIVRGRGFAPEPGMSIVINEALAKQYWPRGDAIGQCMRIGKRENPCYTVIGIAENSHRRSVIEKSQVSFFTPLAHPPVERGMGGYNMIVRVNPDDMGRVIEAARRIIRNAFPKDRPRVTRMDDAIAPAYRPFRLGARLFTAFGLLAFLVASVGVYSTVSYTVTQRTHEFGVRIALGATMNDVVPHVVEQAMRPVAIGVVVGIGAALASGRLIASLLYEVSPTNGVVIIVVSLLLLSAAALAALIPAARAARVDPMIALRTE